MRPQLSALQIINVLLSWEHTDKQLRLGQYFFYKVERGNPDIPYNPFPDLFNSTDEKEILQLIFSTYLKAD